MWSFRISYKWAIKATQVQGEGLEHLLMREWQGYIAKEYVADTIVAIFGKHNSPYMFYIIWANQMSPLLNISFIFRLHQVS